VRAGTAVAKIAKQAAQLAVPSRHQWVMCESSVVAAAFFVIAKRRVQDTTVERLTKIGAAAGKLYRAEVRLNQSSLGWRWVAGHER
jgi:hypothetical protein